MKRKLSWLALLLLVTSLILNFFLFQENQKLGQGIKVLAVLDGDTILLDGKVRLRLRFIDAPELEFCGGKQAKELLESLVKGKKVVLKNYILDQRSRPLALVWLGNKLINEEMLLSGWGQYHSDVGEQKERLKEAGKKAENEKRGIFSSLCRQTENLENPKCVIKGNIDRASGKKLYYYPGCTPQYPYTIVEKNRGE